MACCEMEYEIRCLYDGSRIEEACQGIFRPLGYVSLCVK
jgi:hypothetical protein